MIVYRTAPQKERKAQAELRRAHIRAYLPQETLQDSRRRQFRKVVAPGYVFADSKPPEAMYVRQAIGQIERLSLAPLYTRQKQAKPAPPRPMRKGDRVTVKLGTGPITGTISKLVSRGSRAIVETAGRDITVSTQRLELAE